MVKIKVKGQEYILRFDMSVSEWMEQEYGDLRNAVTDMRKPGKGREMLTGIFLCMANAAEDYLGTGKIYRKEDVQLIDRHTSMGRVAAIRRAIEEAIKDGSAMQSTDEDGDTKVRDDYLEEVKRLEAEKN